MIFFEFEKACGERKKWRLCTSLYKESQIGTELELKFLKIGIIKRKKKIGGQIERERERERERGGDEMRGCEMKWAWHFLNNL